MASRGTTHGDMCRTNTHRHQFLSLSNLFIFLFLGFYLYFLNCYRLFFLKLLLSILAANFSHSLTIVTRFLTSIIHFIRFFYSFIHLKSSDVAFLYVSTNPPPPSENSQSQLIASSRFLVFLQVFCFFFL